MMISIRRIQGDSSIFKSQIAYLVATLGWTVLHLLNHYLFKCWVVCKLYAFFLHSIHFLIILYIWERLDWYDPARWTGTYTDADRELLRTNPTWTKLIKALTVTYVAVFLYCDSVRGCTIGPTVCLPTTEMTKLSGGLMFISKGIQMLLVWEHHRKSRIFRQKLRPVGLRISDEIVSKLTVYNATSVAIFVTDVFAIGLGMVLISIHGKNINEEKRIVGSHNINIILVLDIFVTSILMLWGKNWRYISIYHLLCQKSPFSWEKPQSIADDWIADEDDIPLGGTYNNIIESMWHNSIRDARALTLITTANGQKIPLRRIQYSGTRAEIQTAYMNGNTPDFNIPSISTEQESSTRDTNVSSSGTDLVFPEEYVKKEPALAKALENRRIEKAEKERQRKEKESRLMALSKMMMNRESQTLSPTSSAERQNSAEDENDSSTQINFKNRVKKDPAFDDTIELFALSDKQRQNPDSLEHVFDSLEISLTE